MLKLDFPFGLSTMNELYGLAIRAMEIAFRRLEQQIQPPVLKPWKDDFVFRYAEQSIEQALIQKLARVISGLYVVNLLLKNGFVQEQAVIQRTLDELDEDILFLVMARTNDTVTDLHRQYLQSFYEEEFDNPEKLVSSKKKRHMVPRRKIQAYLAGIPRAGANPSRELDLSQTLHKVYSGFVHAASPQIMDMFGGNPPRFHTSGMLGTPRIWAHRRDAQNYFYRGLCSATAVAKAFGDAPLVEHLYTTIDQFERLSGVDHGGKRLTKASR